MARILSIALAALALGGTGGALAQTGDYSDFIIWRKAWTLGTADTLRICVPAAPAAVWTDRYALVKVQFATSNGQAALERLLRLPAGGVACAEVTAAELAAAGVTPLPSGELLLRFDVRAARGAVHSATVENLSAGQVVSRIALLLPAIQSAPPAN